MTTKSFLSARRSLALAAVAMVAAAACSGGSEEATITTRAATTTTEAATTTTEAATTTVVETTTTSTVAPVAPVVIRQPLTGEPLDSEAELVERPALAVKIDNHPGARRNHSGLAVADIVYEEKVEGSLTRFAAVFHTQDADPVGPIRSGREQDVALLSSLNEPLFGWSGGNPGVTALIRASFLVDIGAPLNSGSYYRGPGAGPHNLYSDTDSLYALTPDDHPGAPSLQFGYLDDGQVFAGEPGRDVSFTIGSIDIEWTWDDEEERYQRSQEGDEHIDKTYGRIGAENVILLGVDYRPSSIDRNAPEAITLGSGLVSVFSNGEYVSGTWARELEVARFRLTLDDGQTIQLTPGQTWVELVEVSEAGEAPAFEVS
jgi:hypothetical protein